MRFLIARLSSLGDVVCCLPAATILKQAFPDAEITWAVDPRFAGIVECCSVVDHVLSVKPTFAPRTWPRFSGRFDAVLDLQGLSKSAIVVGRAQSSLKLGYHWQREGSWLFSAPVIPDPTSVHIVDQYIDVARAVVDRLGGEQPQSTADFSIAPLSEDVTSVKVRLAEKGAGGDYALLNPGAGWITKRWPPENFARVVDWLWGAGITPVTLGGAGAADHAAVAEVIASAHKAPVDLTGTTSVRELVALVHAAKLHIGGDTGSSHLAAAQGIPAVGLYSITRPERSCPYGQFDSCLYDPNGLNRISVEAVLELLGSLTR